MTPERERVRRLFAVATGRPVRWLSDGDNRGDFEGREDTLEVFDVAAREQWPLFLTLGTLQNDARRRLGRRVFLIFHTPAATTQHFPDVRASTGPPARDIVPGRSVRAVLAAA